MLLKINELRDRTTLHYSVFIARTHEVKRAEWILKKRGVMRFYACGCGKNAARPCARNMPKNGVSRERLQRLLSLDVRAVGGLA